MRHEQSRAPQGALFLLPAAFYDMGMESHPTKPPRAADSAGHDNVDYQHRHFVNLLALVFLLLVALATVWVFRAMDDNEKLRRCVDADRHDCGTLGVSQSPRSVVIINH